ncbi:MAG: alpha/beta hydrolase [Oscillospiraceae bacterium]
MKPNSIHKKQATVFLIVLLVLGSILLLILHRNQSNQANDNTNEVQKTMSKIQIETVTTDLFSMDYFRFGKGEKTLVILPGLSVQSVMGSADAVAAAYQSLTDDFTVYLFDRRKELPDSYSVKDMANDTDIAIRAIRLENICLFGASQGGMIAMQIAADDPALVEKLVLASTTSCMTEQRFQVIDTWIGLAQTGDREALYLSFGEALYPQELFEQSREMLTEVAKTVTDEELVRFTILAEGMRDFDITDNLEQISCPVFAVGSKDDKVLGADASIQIAEQMQEHTDFEYFLYDNYGHALYDTAPDFQERMLQFLTAE